MLLNFRYTAVLLVVHGGMVWTLMPWFRLSWRTLAVTRTQLLTPLGSLINFASSLTEWQSKLSDLRSLSRIRDEFSGMPSVECRPWPCPTWHRRLSCPTSTQSALRRFPFHERCLQGFSPGGRKHSWKRGETSLKMQEVGSGGSLSPVILGCRTVLWLCKVSMPRRATWWVMHYCLTFLHEKDLWLTFSPPEMYNISTLKYDLFHQNVQFVTSMCNLCVQSECSQYIL